MASVCSRWRVRAFASEVWGLQLATIVVATVVVTVEWRGTAKFGMSAYRFEDGVGIRLLGDLHVMRVGRVVPLAASRRTRALLGYLVATARPHTRTHLCDLLWEGPDDPRAALRWSLTKLRPVVNDRSVLRLEADRERVQFIGHGAHVDVDRVAGLLPEGPSGATLQSLEEAAVHLLRGEFLDGLDLPRCYRFHHWCMAERERFGNLRRQVLGALIDRLKNDSERALPYVRALVAADPLSEAAHAMLVRILAEGGRAREAEAHYTYARDLLQRELAAPLSGALQRCAIELEAGGRGSAHTVRSGSVAPAGEAPSHSLSLLVGHIAGRRKIDEALRSLAEPSKRPMLMFLGEPGIGKTRLLKMAADNAAAADARVISGRCFEAEMVRPYGIWVDALRAVPPSLVPQSRKQDLAVLQPTSEIAAPEDGSRTRLFGAVADLIGQLARERPLVVVFDDLQWIDEGSASLLHFVMRTLGPSRTLFVAAAREDEIYDNPWAKRLLQSLERDCRPDRLSLAPLNREETAALIGPDAAEVEITIMYRESGGNPLFILELAHAQRRGDNTSGQTLEMLIDERVQRLDSATREVIVYAAVFGREFRPELLGAALGIPELQLAERIERLERRGLLRPTSEGHCDFCHDLVRQVTYRKLSQVRRRIIHRRIAAALAAATQLDGALNGDLVRHAGLAEDYPLAVRACVAAGDRCLRMFANTEAVAVADMGHPYLQHISSGPDRTRLQIALLNVKIQGAFHIFAPLEPTESRVVALLGEVRRAADEAEVMGLSEEAAAAYNLIAWLTWRLNESDTARAATLDAERTSRTADDATRCLHLANTGRCLLDVEADVERARRFLTDAAALASKLNLHVVEIEWGLGLIARWDGDLERAHAHTERAVSLARIRENRWRELECMLWLAKIDLELERFDDAIEQCEGMLRLAERIDGALTPIAKALRLLARLRKSRRRAEREVEECVVELRKFDDKANLAYFLNGCALFELEYGRRDRARAHAREAFAAASAVKRTTEMVVASAVLARLPLADNDQEGLARHVENPTPFGDPRNLSARARSQMELARPFRPKPSNAHSNGGQPSVDDRTSPSRSDPCQSSSSNEPSRRHPRTPISKPSARSRRSALRSTE